MQKLKASLPLLVAPALACGWAASTGVRAQGAAPGSPSTPIRLAEGDDQKAGNEFFTNNIQPILKDNCQGCHGEKRQRGKLRLDSREAVLKGGQSGPAIVPGDPDKSLLIKAVNWTDADLKMPPKAKLKDEQIADLTKWVKMGAPWPAADNK